MAKLIDETGNKYGRLTVIEKAPNTNKTCTSAYWLCRCDCGNYKKVMGTHLRNGTIQSCGCLARERVAEYNTKEKLVDLTGQRFGKLLVLERSENKGIQPAWKCQCDCGTITYVMGTNLTREGGTKSCGCMHSKGEYKIIQLLNENNIKYQKEYKFDDCKLKDKLRFDFAIFDDEQNLKYLIEYNGEQHYIESRFKHSSLKEIQMRDNIKKRLLPI